MKRLVLALIVVGLAALAPPAGASFAQFRTPSGNIGCFLASDGAARCDIQRRDWTPPRKPASCDLDYGHGLAVGRTGWGRFVCAGDTVGFDGRVLGYGRSISRGRYRCTSRRSGVTCVNRRTGHGFKLSRQRATRF